MKKVLTFIIAFGLIFTGFGVANASGLATLSFSPESTNIATGGIFNFDINIDPNGENLDTVRLVVNYPANMLEVTDYTPGLLFPTESPGNSIDNTSGTISQGSFKTGGDVTEAGTVGTISFRALSGGTAVVSFDSESHAIEAGEEKLDLTGSDSVVVTISGDSVGSGTTLEEQALVYFGAFYGYMPSTSADWSALHCFAYGGCSDEIQDVEVEGAALETFGAKYGTMPSTSLEWNVVHTLAYTDFLTKDGEEEVDLEEEVEDVEVVEEIEEVEEVEDAVDEDEGEVVEEEGLEQMALVYFGAFYGYMPSTSADWDALHCFAYGGCQGDPQDLEAEGQALVTFGAKYGTMPSTSLEWNVVHTLAYTEFLTVDEN
jgi:hypothetical protein